jgi:DTW domain-containing protein YfiP
MEKCVQCEKDSSICICSHLKKAASNVRFVVLRHPQEKNKALGTALLLKLTVPDTVVRTGLSWAKLSKVLGDGPNAGPIDSKNWGVLFFSPTQSKALPQISGLYEIKKNESQPLKLNEGEIKKFEGFVFLDGNWSQAKTLWWRNPWLLKLRKLQLVAAGPRRFAKLRRAPKNACLSTIEAAAECLQFRGTEEDKEAAACLIANFENFLSRIQQQSASPSPNLDIQ